MKKNQLKNSQNTESKEGRLSSYRKYIAELVLKVDGSAVEKIASVMAERSKKGNTIFLVGNGGSAANASHFATDLASKSRWGRPPLRAMSLVDNVPLMTAAGNDWGYEESFTSQMEGYFRKGDVLVAISCSGNSPNVVAAAKLAKKMGGVSVGLTGFDGGELAKVCDYVINIPTKKGEYEATEDIHMILAHSIAYHLQSNS